MGRPQAGGGRPDVQIVSVLGFAIPGFLIAIFLVNIFAIRLGWFKPTGFVPLSTSFTGWLSTVTLPIIALSIGAIAAIAAQIRGGVIDTMRQDWVRTLRSRGLPENRVLYKHVLRNAGGPALAVLAVQFVGLLGGAIIVEQIFAIPGLGQVAIHVDGAGRHPARHGSGRRDGGHRRHRQHRPGDPPRIPQPEGACLMSESATTPALDLRVEENAARSHVMARVLRNPTGLASIIILVIVFLIAVFADFLAPMDPNQANINEVMAPPERRSPARRRQRGPRHPVATAVRHAVQRRRRPAGSGHRGDRSA